MKLLVIVVTYNGMKWLDKCLSSIVNSSIASDLYIVDNGSSDGSKDFVKQNYPDAVLVESKENLGFGRANNMGLKYALDNNYDFVYLLNQDAWVESDTFEKLIAVSKDNAEYGILSPLQTNALKDRLDKSFAVLCPPILLSDLIMKQPLKKIYSTKNVMAAHWLISRLCLEQVGGFSPTFPHYGEDVNYAHRALYHGFEVGICTVTRGVHDRSTRKPTDSHECYMKYIETLIGCSNPLQHKRWLKCIKDIIMYRIDKNKISITNIFKIIINIFQIQKNYKNSLLSGRTFLN